MAKKIEVIIGADNKPLKAALNESQSALKSFSSFTTGLAAGFGISIFQNASSAVSSFFAGAQAEALEAERVVTSLRQTLANAGRSDLFTGILAQADELQKRFKTLDNDDITAVFQRLITFGGLTENEINKLLPLIIDFNAKQKLSGDTNKSLAETAEQVIKGIQGQGREMKVYGVEVNAANTSTENLGIIMDQLGPKVKGAGDAFTNSLEGQLAASTQRVKDLQEALGGKLLPLKAKLLQFANEVADGLGLLIDRLQLGSGLFSKLQDLKVRVNFVQGESNKKFESIKDSPLADLTTELIKAQASLDRTNLGIKAGKSNEATINQWKLEAEVMTDLISKIKEQIRLRGDSRTIGQRISETETGNDKKATDALKTRISALKELIAAQVDVGKSSLELKNLEIQLIQRDGKAKGLTEEEIKKLIFARFPDFTGEGLTLSKPVVITAPVQLKTVFEEISNADPAGDNLSQGIKRMYNRIVEQGNKYGAEARKKLAEPLQTLTTDLQGVLVNSLASVGEAIGESLAGVGNPAAAFISVIADALQSLGKALIAYGIAKKIAIESFKSLNPFIAIAAGIAAIAAGALLKKQLTNSAPRLAEGGITTGPTIAMIGEAGREVVAPLDKLRDLIGGGGSTQVEFVEARRRGEDLYEIWKIHHNKNTRLH